MRMGEEEAKKVEAEGLPEQETPPRSVTSETAKDMTEVMSTTPEEKVDEWKALTVIESKGSSLLSVYLAIRQLILSFIKKALFYG